MNIKRFNNRAHKEIQIRYIDHKNKNKKYHMNGVCSVRM